MQEKNIPGCSQVPVLPWQPRGGLGLVVNLPATVASLLEQAPLRHKVGKSIWKAQQGWDLPG